ncbi:hypothetical protein RHSIM_Rhsim02G0130000 [Rhododendron simsii]|uniref:Uncharacterized protein n=1 Tax=Rhododendron simsii TaxID=118357 RepID=A0A834HCZ9_RHOSS|nr:hypothetical protein RHSIM_Rhsim02G0130000 [Rhododendron simsii]
MCAKVMGFDAFCELLAEDSYFAGVLAGMASGQERIHGKAEDFVQQLQCIHKETEQHLRDSTARYKHMADKKWRFVEFEVGNFVYAILTKDRYFAHNYNKLATRKIGPVEVV